MRLQCRVTPATSELLAHLEGIAPDFRAKRLVMLAAMYLSLNAGDGTRLRESDAASPAPSAASSPDTPQDQAKAARPVAEWIRGAHV